jgi:hypothetical protein
MVLRLPRCACDCCREPCNAPGASNSPEEGETPEVTLCFRLEWVSAFDWNLGILEFRKNSAQMSICTVCKWPQ